MTVRLDRRSLGDRYTGERLIESNDRRPRRCALICRPVRRSFLPQIGWLHRCDGFFRFVVFQGVSMIFLRRKDGRSWLLMGREAYVGDSATV